MSGRVRFVALLLASLALLPTSLALAGCARTTLDGFGGQVEE